MTELELRTKQTTLLNEMGSLLACSAYVPEACAVFVDSAQKLFPDAPSGALYMFKSSRDLVEAAVRWGTIDVSAPTFPPTPAGLCAVASLTGVSIRDAVACLHVAKSSTTECLCVPMVAQGNTIGVLHLEFEMQGCHSGLAESLA